MWLPAKRFLQVTAFFIGGSAAVAQTSTVSNPLNGRENNPYSKYGLGELSNTNNTVLRGMGNATAAFADPFSINTDNPASYAALQRTVFELGATASSRTITGSDLTYKTGTATISYLTLAVPFNRNKPSRKHGGVVLGFRPYSRIFYNMQDTVKAIPDPQSTIYSQNLYRQYAGDGSLNNAFLGVAYQVNGFSLGANFGYMFGNILRTTAIIPDSPKISGAYAAEYTNFTRIGGIYWKAGAQYDLKLDSTKMLRFGVTLNLGQNLNERLNEFQISSYNFSDTIVNDTTLNRPAQRGTLTLPLSYSIGVSFLNKDKWNVCVQYTSTQWSGFKSTVDNALATGVGTDAAYKFSAGASYTPDAGSVRKYLSRMTYRFGAYYGKDYLNIAGNKIDYYGGTVGVCLPFKRSFDSPHSAIDMALDMGRLGAQQYGLTQQNYIRFTVGLTINARWGIPRKYD